LKILFFSSFSFAKSWQFNINLSEVKPFIFVRIGVLRPRTSICSGFCPKLESKQRMLNLEVTLVAVKYIAEEGRVQSKKKKTANPLETV
jgi:hypothetical protein